MRPSGGIADPNGHSDLRLGALIKHHWSDWLFLIILVILEIILNIIHPYRRYVSQAMLHSGDYSYPMRKETVPLGAVPVISIVIPLVFIIAFFIWKRLSRDLHHAILGLLTAVLLTAVITDALKDGLGMLRPDFVTRCYGSPIAAAAATAVYGADGNVLCIGSSTDVREGYKSFPSGHTSWSFAGLGYLAMYLAGKIGFFDRRGHSWKLFPVVLPLLVATFVGVSRIDNYRHHWFDVVVAAILGLLVAYFCYRLHYPSLVDEERATPFPFMAPRRDIPLTATSSDYPNHHFNGAAV